MLEKSKRITEHRLSYIEVKRKDQSEDTLDGFDVTVRNHQKFKMVKNPTGKEEKPSGKNVFGRCIESEASAFLTVTYRLAIREGGWQPEGAEALCCLQQSAAALQGETVAGSFAGGQGCIPSLFSFF